MTNGQPLIRGGVAFSHLKKTGDRTMTSIELRQKLINQIDRLSFEKLLVVEKLIESLESHLPETSKNIDSAAYDNRICVPCLD